jgi:hypothetical protein
MAYDRLRLARAAELEPDGKARPSASRMSGTHPIGIGRLRGVMQRYISSILVDSVLDRALGAHPGGADLHAITEDCMIGLRLFVEEQDLPSLMLELADVLEELDGR